MATIIDGKKVAEAAYSKILLDLSLLPLVPKMVFVLVGDNSASQTYVKAKTRKCTDLGVRSETIEFPTSVTEEELLRKIRSLNEDKDVQGILVQLPLPKHLVKNRIVNAIDPLKDVDGLHPENMGRLMQGEPQFVPCTPAGIVELLRYYSVPMEGARTVVVGRSEIVGKPIAQLMLMQNSTVTICHSKTRDLAKETAAADILIAAMGQPKFINASMVKEGAVVIDVGIHRVNDKIVGDVDFDSVSPKVKAITPVPGGVGKMTIAMLMKNLALAATLKK